MNIPALYKNIFRQEAVFLPLLLILALAIRLANIGSASFWIDEVYSLMVANVHVTPSTLNASIHPAHYFYEHFVAWQPMDVGQLLAALKINVHMPFYYLLLNPWLGIFGNTESGLRSFSAVFSTLMLLPLYGLGCSLGGGKKAGVFCLLVAALTPFQIYYAQEGRMYAFSLFWATLSGLSFWKTLYAPKPAGWSLLYALSTVGGLFSHYMFVFFLGFQGIYTLLWLFKTSQKKRALWLGLAGKALMIGAYLWWPVYQVQQQGVADEYHFAKGLVGWLRYVTALIWQPLVTIAGDNALERVFYFPITVLLFVLYLLKPKSGKSRFQFQVEGFLLLWIFCPLLLQIGYDLFKHTHTAVIDRYALLISPAMCLWLGLSLSRVSNWGSGPISAKMAPLQAGLQNLFPLKAILQKLKPGLLVGIMLALAIANVWQASPFRDEHNKDKDIRGKIRYMVQNAQPDDLVLANGPWGALLIAAFYLNQMRPAQPIVYWINQHMRQTLLLPNPSRLQAYQRVWLFRYRANNERGLQQVKDYLQAAYPHVQKTQDWFLYSK